MPTISDVILVITATTTGLIAGLFYAYSCSVNLGLGRLSDAAYLTAMQSINRAILNPVFFISFLGAALLLPLSTALHYGQPISTRFWFLLTAAIVYLVGGIGVTFFGNVPLNQSLDAFNIQSASEETIFNHRSKFERPWNNLNVIRTIACIVSLVLVILACLRG